MKIKIRHLVVLIAVIAGAYLRLMNLGQPPLWIDEAFYATKTVNFEVRQEYVPAIISQFFGVENEYLARLPFALMGVFTIWLVYFINKSEWSALLSLLVATFPLFVFYDRMCRPYVMAGTFLVLSWRWRWLILPLIFTTPIALVGINWIKAIKWKFFTPAIIILTIIIFIIRQDLGWEGGNMFTVSMFTSNPRLWYIPILAVILYFNYYYFSKLKWKIIYALFPTVLAIFLFIQSLEIKDFNIGPPLKKWYSHYIYYNDWRGMPPVDAATNFPAITKYYTGKEAILLRNSGYFNAKDSIDYLLRGRDTLLIGVDCYVNLQSKWFFPEEFIKPIKLGAYTGEVYLARMIFAEEGIAFDYKKNPKVEHKPYWRKTWLQNHLLSNSF